MPIMDGIEASRRIRTAGFTAPIVGLTGNATKECRNAYLDVFDMYQTKPFTCDVRFVYFALSLLFELMSFFSATFFCNTKGYTLTD